MTEPLALAPLEDDFEALACARHSVRAVLLQRLLATARV